jgi:LAO/AO transport system kinase
MMKNISHESWFPEIIKSVASENKGIEEISTAIWNHRDYLLKNDLFLKRREDHIRKRIREIVEGKIKEELWNNSADEFNSAIQKVVLGSISPYHLAEDILYNFRNI